MDEFAESVLSQLLRVRSFRDSLDSESDRGYALLAASFLDAEITRMLAECFVQEPQMDETLFGSHAPFSTFSAKIDAAYYLGQVSKSIYQEMHLVRRIRNDFGHDPAPISFDSKPLDLNTGFAHDAAGWTRIEWTAWATHRCSKSFLAHNPSLNIG